MAILPADYSYSTNCSHLRHTQTTRRAGSRSVPRSKRYAAPKQGTSTPDAQTSSNSEIHTLVISTSHQPQSPTEQASKKARTGDRHTPHRRAHLAPQDSLQIWPSILHPDGWRRPIMRAFLIRRVFHVLGKGYPAPRGKDPDRHIQPCRRESACLMKGIRDPLDVI